MKFLIPVMALAVLAGCTSPSNQARAVGPYKTYSSQKAAAVVAQCIEYSWQDEALMGAEADAFMQSTEKGFTVYNTGAEFFVDVQPQGVASAIRYYAPASNPAAERRGAALATCL
ncbi:2-oxoacid ferredoxin oxidoreductase [Pseudomonas viridiflava]|uniref:2-oxoacid ferredoxin oxidoreductase n=1 Tax=Pseudomonas viridiflava TaxID=33069 RepID=UPI000F04EF18|nr:2-oxoacid ferredoxin oxidoreductase [Pseudomonas viridiflava]